MAQQHHHEVKALNQAFIIDSEYQFVKELGQGAYGCVLAAKHKRTGEGCAIKKITSINTKVIPVHRPLIRSSLTAGSVRRLAADPHETLPPRDQVSTARILRQYHIF